MANYIEYNAVKVHGAELAGLGTSALIVTGRSSARKCGALQDVTDVLDAYRIKYTIFDRTEENPSIETVMSAREEGLRSGADFVIGIGGGSPMDAAKAIAVMIKNADRSWELLYETEQAGGVPVACIPTTCGTGSEVTGVAVLTRHDLHTKLTAKQKLFAHLSLVDPGYIENTDLKIIRNTSIDAMGHMIESYINTKATEASRAYALKGLKVWGTVKQYLNSSLPSDPDEKAAVLLRLVEASNLGGYSIVDPGTSLPHGMSYEFTYEKHIPHGMAIGIFQSGFVKMAPLEMAEKVLEAMGCESFEEFYEFIRISCIEPAFRDYITEEEFFKIGKRSTESFLKDKERLEKLPYHMDADVMDKIITMAAGYSFS